MVLVKEDDKINVEISKRKFDDKFSDSVCDTIDDDYSNWYVLHVKSKKENRIKKAFDKYTGNNFKMIVFKREIIHRKSNKEKKVMIPLFPGYIFVQGNIEEVMSKAKKIFKNEYIKPVSFNGYPGKVNPKEMKVLLSSVSVSGTIEISQGLKNGSNIEIIAGPLKKLEGKVLYVNEKKKKAKVIVQLFNRIMTVNLGLDLIQN